MTNLQQLKSQHDQAVANAMSLRTRFTQQAASEGRPLGPGEISAINAAVVEANNFKRRIDEAHSDSSMMAALEQLTGGNGTRPSNGSGFGRSIGAQFISSDVYRWLKDSKNSRTGVWSSPAAELDGFTMHATTLDESAGSGGKLIVTDFQPGILPLPTRPLTMADLIAPGTTNSNTVGYMKETTFTNAAATVAEGTTKPESTLVFDAVTDPVRKIATWIPVTEEMLEDVPAIQSYLDTRLRLACDLALDNQLLNGSVVAPDIIGFLARTGLAAAQPRGADTNADAILKQIAAIATATQLQPTGIVMNPLNWLTIQLAKTADGLYVSGRSPFTVQQPPTLWGLPVALTSAIVANTALVGAFQTASQLFRKGGLRVEASNSHSDFFVKNLVAIRAEQRAALAVYRPSAFGTVTGLN